MGHVLEPLPPHKQQCTRTRNTLKHTQSTYCTTQENNLNAHKRTHDTWETSCLVLLSWQTQPAHFESRAGSRPGCTLSNTAGSSPHSPATSMRSSTCRAVWFRLDSVIRLGLVGVVESGGNLVGWVIMKAIMLSVSRPYVISCSQCEFSQPSWSTPLALFL